MIELKRQDGTTIRQEIIDSQGSAPDTHGEAVEVEPIKIQLIRKYASHITAGGLEDLEQARTTLGHPAFHGMPTFNADANYQALEEFRQVLEWCEDPAHDPNHINKRLAELEHERAEIEARIQREQRALQKNRGEFDQIDTVRAHWPPVHDSLQGRFMRCPILHFLPNILKRMRAVGLTPPKTPDF